MDPEKSLENQDENLNQDQEETINTNDNEILDLLRQTVQETNARARAEEARRIELERELEEIRNTRNNPPKEITSEDYFANPAQVIRAEIEAQLNPLKAFVAQTQKQNAYQTLKARFAADVKYGPLVAKLGPTLDQIMSNIEPNESNMFNAIHTLIGQLAITNPELLQEPKKEEPPKEDKKNMIPAHLRPSSSPRPNKEKDAPKKNYTENERRLMRENNMTEEQWEAYMNAPSSLKGAK